MKLLYFFVVITVLVAVAVALPAKTAEEIAAEENQLVEDLVQYTGTRLTQKRATSCSKKLGESCAYHCECCGPTVSCSTVYVGGKEPWITSATRRAGPPPGATVSAGD
uniref:U17-Hexatoxin-Hc1i_1 n=1 Tax=Hadronyche cerberea TaxID=1107879 RepID=A0A4Q8K4M7_HADCE